MAKIFLFAASIAMVGCTHKNTDSDSKTSSSAATLGDTISADKSIHGKYETDTIISDLQILLQGNNPCVDEADTREKIVTRVQSELLGTDESPVSQEDRASAADEFQASMQSILGEKWSTKLCEALLKTEVNEAHYAEREEAEEIRNQDAIGALTGSIAKIKFNKDSSIQFEYSPSENESYIFFKKDL